MAERKYISLEFTPSASYLEIGRAHLNLADPSEINYEPLSVFSVSRDEAIRSARARKLIFIQTNSGLIREVLAAKGDAK